MRSPATEDLDAIDARLRRASGRLHAAVAAVDARLSEGARSVAYGENGESPLGRHGRPRHRRAVVAVAAVMAVVASAVGGLLALRAAHDRAGVVEVGTVGVLGEPHDYVVPGWLPDGFRLLDASLLDPAPDPAVTGTVVAYGDPGTDDPWNGPRLEVAQGRLGPPTIFPPSDLRPITVDGRSATIGGATAGSPGDVAVARVEVEWGDGDAAMRVTGIDLTPDEVLDAAEHLVDGPGVAAAGLPEGFEELGRGPLSYRGHARGIEELGGLSLTYRIEPMPDSLVDGQVPAGATTQIEVTERPGTADDLRMVRLGNPEVVETTVQGVPAYRSPGSLELFDPGSGQIVRIDNFGSRATEAEIEAELARLAESLRPVSAADVDHLIEPFLPSGPPPLAAGETLLAQGTKDGAWWRVLAVGGPRHTVVAETLQGRFTMSLRPDGRRRDLYVNLGEGATGRTREWFLFGTVRADATVLQAKFPDGSTRALDLHPVEGWPVKVWVGFVPMDLPFPDLVATDATGMETARLSPDEYARVNSTRPGPMGTTEDPATTDCPVVRTFPDGQAYCLVS